MFAQNRTENSLAIKIAMFATLLAFVVIMLGAYTRLKDAGLGCPDWPGCYGQVIVPDNAHRLAEAQAAFPGQVVQEHKAWLEMIHRYAVGGLVLTIAALSIAIFRKRNLPNQPIGLLLCIIGLVVFQALLGKWTVTMQLLPQVVMSHLVGGISIFVLLGLTTLRLGQYFKRTPMGNAAAYKPWAMLALFVVIIQIFLGGWTSSNYAALICPDFPYCQGKMIPPMNFATAFHLWAANGIDFQGGVLDNTARVTIHMMHRLGALITFVTVGLLSVCVMAKSQTNTLRRIAAIMLLLLIVQVALGIANVVWLLPSAIDIAHNAVAALLLLSVVTLNYALHSAPQRGFVYQYAR